MSCDHTKLKVFSMADELVLAVYRATATGLSDRLGFLSKSDSDALDANCAALLRSLQRLVDSLSRRTAPTAAMVIRVPTPILPLTRRFSVGFGTAPPRYRVRSQGCLTRPARKCYQS